MTDHDDDKAAKGNDGERGTSTESVTLRRITPVKPTAAASSAVVDAASTEVDIDPVPDVTDPGGQGTSGEAAGAPEPRASELDLLTTAELHPLVAKVRAGAFEELRPSSPELERLLAPPTLDAPTPPDIEGSARALAARARREPAMRQAGAITQLSVAPRVAPRSLETLPRGTVVGDYEVDRKIGEGAMSEVYSAVHRTIGRRVAIKVVSTRLFDDLDAETRFVREARAVAAIHHPGIVDVFGFGTLDDGRMYLIMEWLHGRSLAARLREGPLELAAACDVMLQITSALRAAHDQGIVHRDLKPDNVFLQDIEDERPIVKLLDFGLAKCTGQQSLSQTRTGQLIGTPLYISPEQARGKDVEASTDIYALGCLAYQLYTGRPPFLADNVADLVAAHLNERPPEPRSIVSDLPATLDALLPRMIEKDPARRPSLAQVRRTIQSVAGVGTSMMAAVADPTQKGADTNLPPAAAPAASPPGAHADPDGDSLVTLEIRDDVGSAEVARGQTPERDVPPQSRVFVIALWIVLVASVAILIWFVTH